MTRRKRTTTVEVPKSYGTINGRSRKVWRTWLQRHSSSPAAIWLTLHKKGSRSPGVTYAKAVEEALCFGWIDIRPNALDEKRYKIFFSLRKAGGRR